MSGFLRLVRVELGRLLHRRAVLVILAAAVVVPTVIGVSVTIDTRPPTAQEISDARETMEQDRRDPGLEESVQQCTETPQDWGVSSDLTAAEIEAQCRETNEPQLEWYLYTDELALAEQRDTGSGILLTLVLAIMMMLLGTTFAGHDWSSGSVSNQLLFEPRRLRVWWAKALVVTGVSLLVATLATSAYWLALDAVASSRDLPSGGDLLLDCLQMGWRASLVAALAALTGYALTMLFRSTVATLGILFGIALAGGALLGVLGFEGRWNPAYNVNAVVTDGTSFTVEVACPPGENFDDSYCEEERTVTLGQGAAYVGTGVTGTVLVSLLWFRRRDVP